MTSRSIRVSRYTPDEYRQRPREFNPALADDIIDRIANGEVLTDICDDRDMPLPGTFLRWVMDDPKLAEQYELAQRIGTDVSFDEIISEAWNNDTQKGTLRVKALMFRVERQEPDRYGPRATIRTGAENKDAASGIDHAAEVRRKLRSMAQRYKENADAENGSGGGAQGADAE